MSSFDPVTYSAVNQLKPFVGQPFLVSTNFFNEKYVTTGQFIDSAVYPKLTANMAGNVNPAATSTQQPLSFTPFITNQTMGTNLGTIWLTFEYDNRFFVLFNGPSTSSPSAGTVFTLCGTSNSNLSTMSIIRTISGSISTFPLPPGYKGPVNNRIYLSSNQFVDLVALTNPSNTNWLVNMALPSDISSVTGWRIAFGNGVYVGVSQSTSNQVIYSSDGITFQSTNGLYSGTPIGVCFGSGKFVIMTSTPALFSDNTIVYSTDGVTWTSTRAANQGTILPNNGFEYSPTAGCFAISCQGNAFYYQYSLDGITWNEAPVEVLIPSGSRSAGIFLLPNGNFITSAGYTSSDGITWSALPNRSPTSNSGVFPLGLNSAPFVYPYTLTSFTNLYNSGNPWSKFGSNTVLITSSFFASTSSMPTFGNQLYFSTSNSAFTTWSTPQQMLLPASTRQATSTFNQTQPIFNGNIVMSLQTGGNSTLFNPATTPNNNLGEIGYSQIAGVRSTDGGQTWQNIIISTPSWPMIFTTFASAGGKFHLMGFYLSELISSSINYRTIIGTSTDGITWNWALQTSGPSSTTTNNLYVDKNGTTYYWRITDQSNARMLYSQTEGIIWSSFGTAISSSVQSFVPALNGGYVFYNGAGNMYWADVATNTSRRFSALPLTIDSSTRLYFGFSNNNLIIYAGSFTMYYSSDNGVTWATYTLPSASVPSSGVGIVIQGDTVSFQSVNGGNIVYYTSLSGISLSLWSSTTPPGTAGLSLGPLRNSDGDLCFMLYSSPTNPNYYIKVSPATQATYFLPAMTSPVVGMKWVVKAK